MDGVVCGVHSAIVFDVDVHVHACSPIYTRMVLCMISDHTSPLLLSTGFPLVALAVAALAPLSALVSLTVMAGLLAVVGMRALVALSAVVDMRALAGVPALVGRGALTVGHTCGLTCSFMWWGCCMGLGRCLSGELLHGMYQHWD